MNAFFVSMTNGRRLNILEIIMIFFYLDLDPVVSMRNENELQHIAKLVYIIENKITYFNTFRMLNVLSARRGMYSICN